MIIITCQDDTQYGFDFEIHADAMRISKTGKVKSSSKPKPTSNHYGSRGYEPGPMHPVTERIIAAVREAVGEAT